MVTNALVISVLKESATLADDKVATSFMEHFRIAFAMKPSHVFHRSQKKRFRKTVRASIGCQMKHLNAPLVDQLKSNLLEGIKQVLLSGLEEAADEAITTLNETSTQPEQDRYKMVADKVTQYVHGIMETKFNMRKYILKSGRFVYVSSNYEDQKRKTMTVVIHGSGKVQSRIWARKLCLSEGLNQGSQLTYLKSLQEIGHSILCANTNQNFPKADEPAQPIIHLVDVLKEVVKKSAARKFNFIALSAGGHALVNVLQCDTTFFKDRVNNVILLDLKHDTAATPLPQQADRFLIKHAVEFITSKQLPGTELTIKNAMSYVTKSSGTTDHDSVPYPSGPYAFEIMDPSRSTTVLKAKMKSAFKALRGKQKAVAKDSGKSNTTDESEDEVVVTGERKRARVPPLTSVSSTTTTASAPASMPIRAPTAATTTTLAPSRSTSHATTATSTAATANVLPKYMLDLMYPVKVFEVENFNLYSFKSNREAMALSVGHSTIFQHPSGFQLGIICTGNGVGLGFYDTAIEKNPPGGEEELQKFVAVTVSDLAHCTYGPINPNEALVHLSALPSNETATSTCRALREKVIYKLHVDDKNVVGRITTPQLLRGFRTRNVPLVCYERLPTKEHYKMIKCVTCKEQYRKDCVEGDSSGELIPKQFSCLACTIPYPGLTNGEGVTNTCPIDNTLTGLALQQSFNRQFENTIPTDTPKFLKNAFIMRSKMNTLNHTLNT
jgi:hypothetical protein